MPAISVMIKPASSACNMRCTYCFYHDVAARREQAGMGMMSYPTARAVIDSAADYADGEEIFFTFQGGEPLLAGKDFFRKFFAYASGKSEKITYALQTNGTLIDKEWARIFAENGVLIGLSLDGGREDNAFRVMSDLSPAFERTLTAAELLRSHGIQFNILSVVTGVLADNIERVYEFFKSNGFKYLQFIPCLRPIGGKEESELYMTNEQYYRFLTTLFKLYLRDIERGDYVSIRRFDNWVRMLRGEAFEECGVGGYCSRQFVVEGGGNVYPCDFYCLDEWLLGNINTSSFSAMANCEKAAAFLRASLIMPVKCKDCPYFRICRGGGCKRARTSYDYCNAYREFFKYAEKEFAALIK